MDRKVFDWALKCFLSQHERYELDVEMFATDDDRSLPFDARVSQEPLAFFDDFLGDGPVYILRRGESFRLRIDLAYDSQLHIPIDKIASVVAKAPDAEAFSLDMVQSRREWTPTMFFRMTPVLDSEGPTSLCVLAHLSFTRYVIDACKKSTLHCINLALFRNIDQNRTSQANCRVPRCF